MNYYLSISRHQKTDGERKMQTEIDTRKAAADIRLVYAYGGGRFGAMSKIALSGRGIKAEVGGSYTLTNAAIERLRKTNTVECDF